MIDLNVFAADLDRVPENLELLAARLEVGLPILDALTPARRVLFLGMGSSKYAADQVARRARARGLRVESEYASAGLLPDPEPGLVVVVVSASGGSRESVAAANRYRGAVPVIAVTNRAGSSITDGLPTVLLEAGEEMSGIACRSFRHTFLVLEELVRAWWPVDGPSNASVALAAAEATTSIDADRAWLEDFVGVARDASPLWLVAPAERMASAQQGALLLRELAGSDAQPSETGDWWHVDAFPPKSGAAGALMFGRSEWQDTVTGLLKEYDAAWRSIEAVVAPLGRLSSSGGPGADRVLEITEAIVPERMATAMALASDSF